MNWFFGLNFVHQSMIVGGAAMVASPIIIHIINRLQFRRVRFAAMEFLLESEQKNRRRILIEQLLLLLLRILIVLAIAFLIARWILDENQLSMLAGVKSHHVVLIDDSGSTRQAWDEQAEDGGEGGRVRAFDKALRVVEALASEGERQEGGQQMTVLLLSRLRDPLFERRDVDQQFLTDLKGKIKNLEPSHRSLQMAEGLEAARQMLVADQTGIRHLHVLSDFRKSDWTETESIAEAMSALEAASISVNLVKTVPNVEDRPTLAENLGITNLDGDFHVAAVDVPIAVTVTVRNFGQQSSGNVVLSLFADGEKLPGIYDVGEVKPGEESDRVVYIYFPKPGPHELEVRLPEDGYGPDNSRFVAVDVADSRRVLVIDGDPDRLGSFYVEAALAPEGLPTGYEPIVQSPEYLRRNSLEPFSAIYMVNVPSLERDAVKPLEDFVSKGGGLAWFMGNQVNAEFYTTTLYGARAQGETPGLFPVPLEPGRGTLRRDGVVAAGPDVEMTPHPIFAGLFEGQDNPFTELIEIYQYTPPDGSFVYVDSNGDPALDADGRSLTWSTDDEERQDGVATIASLRNGDPLVLEHRYGQGRVITCLTTSSPTWNNWAKEPAVICYAPVMLEMQRRLARRDLVPETRVVGEPIRFELDAAEFQEEGRFRTPDTDLGVQKLLLRYEKGEGEEAETHLVRSFAADADSRDETDLPGVYRFELVKQGEEEGAAEVEQRWYAFNVPEQEGQLTLATSDEIRQRLGPDRKFAIQEPGELKWLRGEEVGTDVRRVLLLLLILFLLCEQLLAWRLSFHPESAGARR